MNSFWKSDVLQICFRGPHCFLGYWKDEENTRATIDHDGWVHSGDVGLWTEQGTLRIIDRKKNIFKLAQGEYIAPEKIEGIYLQASSVAQVFVHGESLEVRKCFYFSDLLNSLSSLPPPPPYPLPHTKMNFMV